MLANKTFHLALPILKNKNVQRKPTLVKYTLKLWFIYSSGFWNKSFTFPVIFGNTRCHISQNAHYLFITAFEYWRPWTRLPNSKNRKNHRFLKLRIVTFPLSIVGCFGYFYHCNFSTKMCEENAILKLSNNGTFILFFLFL